MSDAGPALERLLGIMAHLRDPEHGCPWDLQQSFRTIVPHTLEEAYEVADAIERDALDELPGELGDLLFQVVFYAQLGREQGLFDFAGITEAIADKIVRRHPHVFGDGGRTDSAGQRRTWEAIKATERAERAGRATSQMDDVPVALPALSRAEKLQRRAARVGFDWTSREPVMGKVHEELAELEAAAATGSRADVHEEMGDLLFACANLARHLGVDAEQALRDANGKFERRFRGLEAELARQGASAEAVDFERLESAYQVAKAADKDGE
ncbi:nucleoside triphosphate pyrophosphohydrolase [Sediminicurvatus halobius]|uniref:Nucleoside triphosphate pyrophosphohydrolase n=1 Tax=Sediminicurvatus halobius TaxID=2182432 RepID=A0A2U2N299_9GAMM|nr:nucleoside triphosphate pyrophosphohydrolase [Spiribacter halobius]PWG63202.1 nucleoside triphosphate pyrophosphohydrolase [Spiribacter halobius]UEX76728.1 nucleoside triphosphate pyrophosphohydrolase [Spiribacter halobius]